RDGEHSDDREQSANEARALTSQRRHASSHQGAQRLAGAELLAAGRGDPVREPRELGRGEQTAAIDASLQPSLGKQIAAALVYPAGQRGPASYKRIVCQIDVTFTTVVGGVGRGCDPCPVLVV